MIFQEVASHVGCEDVLCKMLNMLRRWEGLGRGHGYSSSSWRSCLDAKTKEPLMLIGWVNNQQQTLMQSLALGDPSSRSGASSTSDASSESTALMSDREPKCDEQRARSENTKI